MSVSMEEDRGHTKVLVLYLSLNQDCSGHNLIVDFPAHIPNPHLLTTAKHHSGLLLLTNGF